MMIYALYTDGQYAHTTRHCFFIVNNISLPSGGQVLHRLRGTRWGGALVLWAGGDAGGRGWRIQGETCTSKSADHLSSSPFIATIGCCPRDRIALHLLGMRSWLGNQR